MRLTSHAEHRRTRRCIPVEILSAIYDFGLLSHSKGAVSLMLDNQSIALACDGDRRKSSALERYRGAYVIVGDGESIVTVARRRRRLRR
jgi:hypothetical protein